MKYTETDWFPAISVGFGWEFHKPKYSVSIRHTHTNQPKLNWAHPYQEWYITPELTTKFANSNPLLNLSSRNKKAKKSWCIKIKERKQVEQKKWKWFLLTSEFGSSSVTLFDLLRKSAMYNIEYIDGCTWHPWIPTHTFVKAHLWACLKSLQN